MALDASNVRVAVTGAVYVDPTAVAAAPTDATTALTAEYLDLGYVSADGVTETRERSTNQIRAWQNADLVREVVTESSIAYTFRLIETNENTIELFYGTTVDSTNGSIDVNPAATGGRKNFVIDVVDGDEEIRVHIPQGEVTAVGDQVYQSGEPIGYEVTVTAYPDTTLGYTARKFYAALDTTP